MLVSTYVRYFRQVAGRLVTPDGAWTVEPSRAGLTVRWYPKPGARQSIIRFESPSMDLVVRYLVDQGVDPTTLRPA